MRKIIVILSMLIGLIAICFSIPAFIQNSRIELTPKQKAAYEQKVRERPDSLSFNPMHVGDKWWRSLSGGSHYLVREVVDSTIINNLVYYKVIGLYGVGQNQWNRNVGNLSLVYDEFDLDNNQNTTELLYENFSNFGYYTVYHDFNNFSGLWSCYCDGEYYLTAYNRPTYIRFHEYTYTYNPTICETRGWAKGYGMTYSEVNGNDVTITACRINGIYYGEPVSVADCELSATTHLELSCYPNPFRESTTINVKTQTLLYNPKIEIYNIKGQRIKTLKCHKSNSQDNNITWDGTDDKGKSVSSGVYFYKLTTPERVITNKMIMLK